MSSEATQSQTNRWLLENGPKELDSLIRAIRFHPSAPLSLVPGDQGGQAFLEQGERVEAFQLPSSDARRLEIAKTDRKSVV